MNWEDVWLTFDAVQFCFALQTASDKTNGAKHELLTNA